jgi:hypothetical protein
MAAGATLDDVLCRFRTRDQLDTLDMQDALCRIASREMDRHTAELIVRDSAIRSYAHLTLGDLELLGDVPSVSVCDVHGVDDVDRFTRHHRDGAIIERKPFLLYVRSRQTAQAVELHASTVPLDEPLPQFTSCINGQLVTFESVCNDVRRSVAAWPTELHILRDEPDQLLLYFLRAPSKNPQA